MSAPGSELVEVVGERLEVHWLADDSVERTQVRRQAPLVFLHEGLGSVSTWGPFPQRLAQRLGRRALLYSRRGYGASQDWPGPRSVDFLHREVEVLYSLLEVFDLERVVLVGHSDGASIALLAASDDRIAGRIAALLLEAPHVLVESLTVESIVELGRRYRAGGLRQALDRHHADVEATFWSWHDVWVHPSFRDWNIAACLPGVGAPVLVVQGYEDQYGTERQVDVIRTGIRSRSAAHLLTSCRHAPHRDRGQRTVSAMAQFLQQCERT